MILISASGMKRVIMIMTTNAFSDTCVLHENIHIICTSSGRIKPALSIGEESQTQENQGLFIMVSLKNG